MNLFFQLIKEYWYIPAIILSYFLLIALYRYISFEMFMTKVLKINFISDKILIQDLKRQFRYYIKAKKINDNNKLLHLAATEVCVLSYENHIKASYIRAALDTVYNRYIYLNKVRKERRTKIFKGILFVMKWLFFYRLALGLVRAATNNDRLGYKDISKLLK